ncbi:uroporphyrinogen decarboxylase [Erythrobacter arachoides]|uniref:Uroporphyrinogen decarboxylase n=1 Tax=Aurantiacibacter arachoides TaxID=1850444 RepID=A0A845A4S4_9SPHN|nr:uroporphyrinogen decarboxylase [Aurantiacibacter arachoides]MXO94644.1 uroporphyrinogen decarboxylase [Aurantiacibacter arachoides]GGD61880.1 uroporphyrinogen decarboxylase [Aurantiacibacter arachoides]
MPGPLLDNLLGMRTERRPVWLMRQAGRYLPEYRALRAEKGGFLELVYDSEAAAEVTVQPIRRFGFDGAILFSDILIVPHALGQDLWFEAGEGPRLAPPLKDAALVDGTWQQLERAFHHFDPVYETVRRTCDMLSDDVTMLGFAGSPWTVATYMVAGAGSKDQGAARSLAWRDPGAFQLLIDGIEAATVEYLIGQIDAGAEAVQLFDSWAGSLSPAQFERWVIAPNARLAAAIHAGRPGIPVIGFPKGAGAKLPAYARETGVDALGIDETQDCAWIDAQLPPGMPVQGNLDPMLLLAGGPALDGAVDTILAAFANRPHVFNLGHGIDKETPIPHVEYLLAKLRAG